MDDYFCAQNPSNCSDQAGSKRLKEVELGSFEYLQVKKLLKKGWRHSKKRKPTLHGIYKILWPLELLDPFLRYRDGLRPIITPENGPAPPEECLLFHGTTRACLLGENSHEVEPCVLPQCSLCSIIHLSFDIARCGSKHKFTRFGTAIYTTGCSSKADDYCSTLRKDANKRVLLLNRVAVGKQFRTPLNSGHLVEPPRGYHSVVGLPGVHLNYEETVVYTNVAIRPAYLLVYNFEPKTRMKAFVRRIFDMPIGL